MKLVATIPARYNSSRLPGKPLLDIHGKPMIWWVYNQVKKVKEFDEVYVATDDQRIFDACTKYGMNVMMTGEHSTHIERIHELSETVDADFYININGDEPLIEPETIRLLIPTKIYDKPVVFGLFKRLEDPVELIDPSNIKVATNKDLTAIMISRSPIPYPYKTILFDYKKAIGLECFNKKALDMFVSHEPGYLETIEDLCTLRFLENGVPIIYSSAKSESLSVDTMKDIEKVRLLMKDRV